MIEITASDATNIIATLAQDWRDQPVDMSQHSDFAKSYEEAQRRHNMYASFDPQARFLKELKRHSFVENLNLKPIAPTFGEKIGNLINNIINFLGCQKKQDIKKMPPITTTLQHYYDYIFTKNITAETKMDEQLHKKIDKDNNQEEKTPKCDEFKKTN